jgi:hypothetical protein
MAAMKEKNHLLSDEDIAIVFYGRWKDAASEVAPPAIRGEATFEEWAKNHGFNLDKYPNGEYKNTYTHRARLAWNAALAKTPSDGGEATLLRMPALTFTAGLFKANWEGKEFLVSGTLDGFIALAVPNGGTYPLSTQEAENLRDALNFCIEDVRKNCKYERDSLLREDGL